MALWSSDLSTQDAAEGATSVAALACFIMAGLCVLTGLFMTGMLAGSTPEQVSYAFIGLGIELVVFLIAGLRFRAGKGFVWGIAAALILLLELLVKLAALAIPGMIINGIALIVIINGIRGAAAMRRGFQDPEEQAEIFS